MPIYEYRCHHCQERVEVLVQPGASPPDCPQCGNPLLERLFSAPHVMQRGSGRRRDQTCCGQEERCSTPPCSEGRSCRRN